VSWLPTSIALGEASTATIPEIFSMCFVGTKKAEAFFKSLNKTNLDSITY
jgi:hypothetical protein